MEIRPKPFTIATLVDPPSTMPCAANTSLDDEKCPLPGLTVDIAKLVCRSLRYDCKFVSSLPAIYGEFVNGTWKGIVGALSENHSRFDTAVPRFTPTYVRSTAIDFSASYFYETFFLFTRQPRALPASETLDLWTAFRWQVWFGMVALMTFVIVHFIAEGHLEPVHHTHHRRSVLCGLCDHRFSHLRFHCKYLVTIILLMATLILTGSYTGYLFSNRVAKTEKPPFVDFDSFVTCVETGDCVMATKTGSFGLISQLIQAGASDAFRRLKKAVIGERAPNPLQHWPLDQLVLKIRTEQPRYVTALAWDTDFYFATGSRQCDYYVIQPEMDAGANSFPLPKNSPHRRTLDTLAGLVSQYGLTKVIFRRYFRHMKCQQDSTHEPIKSDSLLFLKNVFILWGIGEAGGVCVLIVEIVINRILSSRTSVSSIGSDSPMLY